ncbi:MAG TPA: RnfABCDGE type electron transport complex subunit G [Candidatus Limivivens merdigallinarum]|uniref:Ion-translocating oxidoreductase complex subunit G n=1 Tax=Candidatus Limivivens merdigallinarum TaxID=2840859 RepID=A0A9D0ZX08_9FIRM|nr:RnfABCDGE type electron transport complex subunit G [Candidatus Limivivens merdigallinarum]
MSKIIKNALILMAITLVAGLALGFVYDITKEPIAEQEQKAKAEAYEAVFPDAATLETIPEIEDVTADAREVLDAKGLTQEDILEVMLAKDDAGNTLGVVMNITTHEGYGGDINFSMGIQKDGTVNGIQILSISETAGLGMKAAEEDFYGQYAGKKVDSFNYTKTGASADNEINAISGATITTNAVTNGVNAGIYYYQSLMEGGILDE